MATPRRQLSASSEARRRTPCKPNMQRAQRPAGSLANPACSELRGPPSQTRRPQETPFFFTPPCRGRPGKSGRPVRTKSAPDPCTAAACRHGGGFTTAGLAAGTAAGTCAFTACLPCFSSWLACRNLLRLYPLLLLLCSRFACRLLLLCSRLACRLSRCSLLRLRASALFRLWHCRLGDGTPSSLRRRLLSRRGLLQGDHIVYVY